MRFIDCGSVQRMAPFARGSFEMSKSGRRDLRAAHVWRRSSSAGSARMEPAGAL